MYNHKMKLQLKPFEKMVSGLKTIELRLWDEKRQKVVLAIPLNLLISKTIAKCLFG